MGAEEEVVEGNENQIEVVYPKAGEDLLEFLHRIKAKVSEVILFLRCSAMLEKKAARKVEGARQAQQKRNWEKNQPQHHFNKRAVPNMNQQFPTR